MKKIIALIIALVMLMCLAACQPANPGTNDSTPGTSTPVTDDPTEDDIVIGGGESSEPTQEPTQAPTQPPVATELADSGFCAVGIVDAAAGTAKVLGDNGVIAEIKYNCEETPVPGKVYNFVKNGDVYDLSKTPFINADYSAWNVRVFDNNALGTPDGLYTHDGVNETFYDLAEDCVVFCRFSETEYRIFRGSDCIKYSDWPMGCYFTAEENPNGGNRLVTVMLVCSVDSTTWIDGHANEATTYFFDNEGFGWSDGDLIIE